MRVRRSAIPWYWSRMFMDYRGRAVLLCGAEGVLLRETALAFMRRHTHVLVLVSGARARLQADVLRATLVDGCGVTLRSRKVMPATRRRLRR